MLYYSSDILKNTWFYKLLELLGLKNKDDALPEGLKFEQVLIKVEEFLSDASVQDMAKFEFMVDAIRCTMEGLAVAFNTQLDDLVDETIDHIDSKATTTSNIDESSLLNTRGGQPVLSTEDRALLKESLKSEMASYSSDSVCKDKGAFRTDMSHKLVASITRSVQDERGGSQDNISGFLETLLAEQQASARIQQLYEIYRLRIELPSMLASMLQQQQQRFIYKR